MGKLVVFLTSAAALALGVAGRTCDCDCCEVTSRPPAMQVRGVDTMCSQKIGDSSCDGQCQIDVAADPSASRVVSTAADYVLDANRYCLMYCLPNGNNIGDPCMVTNLEQRTNASTSGGNGQDWANGEAPDVSDGPEELEAPQISDAISLEDAASAAAAPPPAPGPGAAEEEEEEDVDQGAFLAEAEGLRATATGLEARMTEAESKSARVMAQSADTVRHVQLDGTMVHDSRAELRASAVQAAIYAKTAQKSADLAAAELAELQALPQQAANAAAAKAIAELQAETGQNRIQDSLMEGFFTAGVPPPAPEAAQKAAAPYIAAMNKAVAARSAYEIKAQDLQKHAKELQDQARVIGQQAVGYQSVGNSAAASQMMAQATGMINDANAADEEAGTWHGIAEQINSGMPLYQANGAQAMARAAAIANPAGQLPPVPAALLQADKVPLPAHTAPWLLDDGAAMLQRSSTLVASAEAALAAYGSPSLLRGSSIQPHNSGA